MFKNQSDYEELSQKMMTKNDIINKGVSIKSTSYANIDQEYTRSIQFSEIKEKLLEAGIPEEFEIYENLDSKENSSYLQIFNSVTRNLREANQLQTYDMMLFLLHIYLDEPKKALTYFNEENYFHCKQELKRKYSIGGQSSKLKSIMSSFLIEEE